MTSGTQSKLSSEEARERTTELLREVRRIEIQTSRLVDQHLSGSYQSMFKGQGVAFSEVRAYEPGDDVRSIDWNVTARTGEPHVKLFTEERELTVMLIVDMSASLDFGTCDADKRHLVAKLVATFAFSAIRNNDRVGLIGYTDGVEVFVPPRSGRKHSSCRREAAASTCSRWSNGCSPTSQSIEVPTPLPGSSTWPGSVEATPWSF
jgi:uncharacterized protein (DUF58 family)